MLWQPNPGPQTLLISCPIEDVLYGGARGGGKTDGFLGDWIAHQDEWGPWARGVIFRRTYDELEEIQERAIILFAALGAKWVSKTRSWVFPIPAHLGGGYPGAKFRMRFLEREDDAKKYKGHQYTWIGIEEADSYASAGPIDFLRACLRSPHGVPCYMRLNANPGGPGHGWLKQRYIDPAPPLTPFVDPEAETERVFIPALLEDNPKLTENDPGYWKRVKAAAGGNKALEEAWRFGNWDVMAGGMFDDVFRRAIHVVEPFEIPESWFRDRSFDWGSSRPFCVLWWAVSDGTLAPNGRIYPRGTMFITAEWYGCTGKANEGIRMLATDVAKGIVGREREWGAAIFPGPADTQIYDVASGIDSVSIADKMAEEGVYWTRADKSPGSRKIGWELMRIMLAAALPESDGYGEEPALYVFNTCRHWIRTVPVLPRDKVKVDDVHKNAEDHAADATRYRLVNPPPPEDDLAEAGVEREEAALWE